MGCMGDRENGPTEQAQKWDFITLSDFKATSVWTSVAYIWLWLMALVSVAVYAADTFTAVNLLAFNKWSSQVQPALEFKYSKWIFAICICLSWALAIFEWIRAIRVIRRGGVAESYMDSLAVTLQSMRGKGWRRFLVFTELTKSKKGVDYIAFFVYFAFKGAVRIILAEGPRQAVNAMTLYAVMNADLVVKGTPTQNHSNFEQFWLNVEALADKNAQQAVILFSMLFTMVIWVFSAISLIIATVLYLVFLWHYVPQRDGRLSIYCRRKIDRRLEKIVAVKVKAAIEEEETRQRKAEQKAELKRQKTGELPPPTAPKIARQPTLPQLGATPEMKSDDKLPEFPLSRQDTNATIATLPVYSSRPPTRNENERFERQPTLPGIGMGRPGAPSRNATQNSAWSSAPSYESNAPLLANAGYAGEVAGMSRPPTAFSRQDTNAPFDRRPLPSRNMTQSTQATQRSHPPPMSRMDTTGSRPFTPMSRNDSNLSRVPVGPRMPIRSNTGFSFDQEPRSAISPLSPPDNYGPPTGPPMRRPTQDSFVSAMTRQESQASVMRPMPAMSRQPTYGSLHSHKSSFSRPIPPAQRQASDPSFEMTSQPPHGSATNPAIERQPSNSGYVAFNPAMHSTSSTPVPQQGPQRSVTIAAGPAGTDGNYFGHVQEVPQRSATAPIDHRATTGYADIFDDYRDSYRDSGAENANVRRPSPPAGPQRSATAGPPQENGWQNRF